MSEHFVKSERIHVCSSLLRSVVTLLATLSRHLIERAMLSHLIEEYSPVMEAGVSLRCSQESSTGQCPEINPVHTHINTFGNIFLHIMLTSTSKPPKGLFSSGSLFILHLSSACHKPYSFHYPHNIYWWTKVMKPLSMHFPPTPYQLPVLKLFSFSRLIPATLNRFYSPGFSHL